jgi:hypothetical protein
MLLITKESLIKLEKEFENIYDFQLFNEARENYFLIKEALQKEQASQELIERFRILEAKYGFVCIFMLTDDEIVGLYKNSIDVALEIDGYDLWQYLKKHLVIYSNWEDRDQLKRKILENLMKSSKNVTNEKIIIGFESCTGIASNWFRDYISFVGVGNNDKLKFEQYFINSPNTKLLNEKTKDKIKRLIKFYERLKISSGTPQGYEDVVPMAVNDDIKIWREGRLEDVDIQAKKAVEELKKLGFFKADINDDLIRKTERQIHELKDINNNYAESSLEKMAVNEEIDIRKKIEDFKIMANKFPAGSLERRAIKEEILKLSK